MNPQPQPDPKWRFAIGTTSVVPNERTFEGTAYNLREHYIMADIDSDNIDPVLLFLADKLHITNYRIQPTPRGWHVYTPLHLPWCMALDYIRQIPNVDQRWLAIGRRRGYLYLADKAAMPLPWPVLRMVIRYVERRKGVHYVEERRQDNTR